MQSTSVLGHMDPSREHSISLLSPSVSSSSAVYQLNRTSWSSWDFRVQVSSRGNPSFTDTDLGNFFILRLVSSSNLLMTEVSPLSPPSASQL